MVLLVIMPMHLRLLFLVGLAVLGGCAGRSPVVSGMAMQFTRAQTPLTARDPHYQTTLQIRWLGTECYSLQMGDKAIFTDPFLTHHSLAHVELGRSLHSDPERVRRALADVAVPQAIFVSHSHYDHLLDAVECLKQPGWGKVPIYGGPSAGNLLAGYGDRFTNTWRSVVDNSGWQTVTDGIRYKAVAAEHGRQVACLPLLYAGKVNTPYRAPPRHASDFRVGETYAFVFELSNAGVTNTIYFIGAPHREGVGYPDDSLKSVDVAILCVPTWKLSKGYPMGIVRRLKARHIIASHYDNFLQVNDKPTEVVPLADMDGFLLRTQQSVNYPEFESITVSSVDSVLRIQAGAPAP
jgi:L-ascorbate metabolism protein UlaG (beta-lactamase superfamily)